VGKVLGAHHLLLGAFVVDGRDNLRIDVRSVNTETSQIEYVQTVTGKADQLFAVVDQLGAKLNAGLKLPPMPMRVRPVSAASGAAAPPKGPEQFAP
jgi:curli biogenesis system outer membrane secretion channel CsgG